MITIIERNFKLLLQAIEAKDQDQIEKIYKALIENKDQVQQLTIISSLNTITYLHYKKSFALNETCIEKVYSTNLAKISKGQVDPLILEDYYSCIRTNNPTENEYINTALEYIRENLDKDLSLDLVAGQVHLNKNYFSTLFKKTTGSCFCKYVNSLRIEKAKDLLGTSTYPLDYIAQKCGYKSQSHFSTTFLTYQGTSPGNFRRQSRLI